MLPRKFRPQLGKTYAQVHQLVHHAYDNELHGEPQRQQHPASHQCPRHTQEGPHDPWGRSSEPSPPSGPGSPPGGGGTIRRGGPLRCHDSGYEVSVTSSAGSKKYHIKVSARRPTRGSGLAYGGCRVGTGWKNSTRSRKNREKRSVAPAPKNRQLLVGLKVLDVGRSTLPRPAWLPLGDRTGPHLQLQSRTGQRRLQVGCGRVDRRPSR